MADAEAPPAKKRTPDPVTARVEMIDGWFNLPPEVPEKMKLIRAAVKKAAQEVAAAVESCPAHDKGRLIAAIDALQLAKNIACDSVILPHA